MPPTIPGSPRNSPRRPGLPSNSQSHPKRVTLEEWEAKAPLGEKEQQSVYLVKEMCSGRGVPSKFVPTSSTPAASSSRSGTPKPPTSKPPTTLLQSVLLQSSPRSNPATRPGTPAPQVNGSGPLSSSMISSTSSAGGSRSTSPTGKNNNSSPSTIETPQQFFDLLTTLLSSLETEQSSLYRSHLSELLIYRETCDDLVASLEDMQDVLGEMREALGFVEERSRSLKEAAEGVLEEQNRLLQSSADLEIRLSYFTSLEPCTRMLNSPGEGLVTSDGFIQMIERIEECLIYLGQHRDFKDAELYIIRYQQCMTRAMTLIKMHFLSSIRKLTLEISKQILIPDLSDTALYALLYTKVAAQSSTLSPLLSELSRRTQLLPDDLSALLGECHSAWIVSRQSLLAGTITKEVERLDPGRAEVVELTRTGCGWLKEMCHREWEIWGAFFGDREGDEKLYGFLESLCDYLYDYLRPRILHEPSLSVLCSVCTVVQALMVLDSDSFDSDDEDSVSVSMPKRPKLQISHLLRPILQDAQTRLFFRAQAVLQSNVRGYVAKEKDLEYPKKIEVAAAAVKKAAMATPSKKSTHLPPDDAEEEGGLFKLPPIEVQEAWYPTLRQTLWVLSQLHTFVDSTVFEDLAQEAVDTCRLSLISASESIITASKSKVDGQLFLVRHLLILKEMVGSIEMAQRDRGLETLGVTEAFSILLQTALAFLGYGPKVQSSKSSQYDGYVHSTASNAKMEIDRELKRVCEDLISNCAYASTAPARAFLERCTTFLSQGGKDLEKQPWAAKEKIVEIDVEVKKAVKENLSGWIGKLRTYLEDEKAVGVLIPPAQSTIVDLYRPFFDVVRSEYDFATSQAVTSPLQMWTLLKSISEE